MKDGLYRVAFDSNQNDYGFGVVSVRNNSINGGDSVCYYQGVLLGNKADLRVVTHNKGETSVFGNLDKFDLELTLKEMPGGAVFNGHIKGRPDMQLTGGMHFLDDLV